MKFVDLCYGVLPSRYRLVEHLIHQLVLTATRLQGFKVPIPALRVARRRQQRQEVESLNLGRRDSYFPRDHLLYVRAVQHIRWVWLTSFDHYDIDRLLLGELDRPNHVLLSLDTLGDRSVDLLLNCAQDFFFLPFVVQCNHRFVTLKVLVGSFVLPSHVKYLWLVFNVAEGEPYYRVRLFPSNRVDLIIIIISNIVNVLLAQLGELAKLLELVL